MNIGGGRFLCMDWQEEAGIGNRGDSAARRGVERIGRRSGTTEEAGDVWGLESIELDSEDDAGDGS